MRYSCRDLDIDLYYACLGMLYSRINDEMNISCKMESTGEVGKMLRSFINSIASSYNTLTDREGNTECSS